MRLLAFGVLFSAACTLTYGQAASGTVRGTVVNPPRIAPRNLFDIAVGHDKLFRGDRYRWGAVSHRQLDEPVRSVQFHIDVQRNALCHAAVSNRDGHLPLLTGSVEDASGGASCPRNSTGRRMLK